MTNNNHLNYAYQQHQQGKLGEALKSYRKALNKEPHQIDALHGLSIVLSQMGKREEALQYIEQAIEAFPHNAALQNSRGNILSSLNRLTEAISAYDKAIQLRPTDASIYTNMANCFFQNNEWKEAESAYLKAITLQPNLAVAHYNYARLLIALKNYPAAIAELKKVLLISPRYIEALGQLGHIYLYRGDYANAIIYYKKRLSLDPQNFEAQYDCGLAYLKNHEFKKAIDHFNQTLSLNADHPEVLYGLATAYVEIGNYQQALTYYLQQLEKAPRLDCYYNIGVLHMYQEKHQEAIDYFKQALHLNPNYLEAHSNLASIYLKINQIESAIEHYQAALLIKPADPEINHILNALQKRETPRTAPTAYIEHLFDEYANYYDQHLISHLQYQVPQKLYEAIDVESHCKHPSWEILDLGCGTGLCGEYFRPLAKKLIGVDASQKMLAIAKSKNIYDQLENELLQVALGKYRNLDLILAGDVFTYIGDLSNIFTKVRQSLTSHGIFAFTTEKTEQMPYELTNSIRFAHSKKYLKSLIKENAFEILRFDNIILRYQKKEPVEGYLILLRNTDT